jgi:thioredoxin 1
MKPVIGEISLLFPNDLLVINLNVEKFYSLASEHGIFSIPTIIMYKNGLKKTVINGAASVEEITKVIREIC